MIWLTAQDAALVHSKVIQTTGGLEVCGTRRRWKRPWPRLSSPSAVRSSTQTAWKKSPGQPMAWLPTTLFWTATSASAP